LGDASGVACIAVALNADRRLEVFALDTVGITWHTQQNIHNGPFGKWGMLDDKRYLGCIAVAANRDGRLEVVAVECLGHVDMVAGDTMDIDLANEVHAIIDNEGEGIRRYHNTKTNDEYKQVYDLHAELLGEHRVFLRSPQYGNQYVILYTQGWSSDAKPNKIEVYSPNLNKENDFSSKNIPVSCFNNKILTSDAIYDTSDNEVRKLEDISSLDIRKDKIFFIENDTLKKFENGADKLLDISFLKLNENKRVKWLGKSFFVVYSVNF